MSELRLYAIVLRLAALRAGTLPADHGDQARAALFNLIRLEDMALSEKLHNTNVQKPYTISLLQGEQFSRDRALHFNEGDTADWRFTLLRDPTFEVLLHRFLLRQPLPEIRIGAVNFTILDAFVSGHCHADSGHIGLSELWQRWNCAPDTVSRQIILRFKSPTTFSLGTEHQVRFWRTLPYPRTLFSTLRKRWKTMAGVEPGDDFDTWVEQHLDAEPIQLSTETTLIEGRRVRGFVGDVRFQHYGDNRWLPLVHLLSDLAFWTGVGYQTTRGMGQVRKIDE